MVSDIFSRDVQANKSPRNAFNIGYSSIFSSPAGLLLPCYWEEVDKGDKLKLGVSNVTRTIPVQTSAFMTFDEKVDFWCVPKRLLWSDYDNWRLGQSYRHRTTELANPGKQYLQPFCRFADIAALFGSISTPITGSAYYSNPTFPDTLRLLDLLGYSVPRNLNFNNYKATEIPSNDDILTITNYYSALSPVTPVNYFKLAAFQCIYMHGYRNEEFEKLDPSFYNMDSLFDGLYQNNLPLDTTTYTTSNNVHLAPSINGPDRDSPLTDRLSLDKLFQPRFKNWRQDIFTSLKPSSGFSSVSGLSFSSGFGNSTFHTNTGSDFDWSPQGQSGNGWPSQPGFHSPAVPIDGQSPESTAVDFNFTSNPAEVFARLRTIATQSNNKITADTFLYPQNIRNLLAQDKFVRSSIYARKNISDQFKAIFGDSYKDHHAPIYLGTYSSTVEISDVVASSDGSSGDSSSVLGQIAGKGFNSDGSKQVFEHTFEDDSIVLGVHYIMPRNNYDSYRIHKTNTKVSRWDYFYPQFDGLGLQPVFQFERNIPSNISTIQNVSSVLGYAPRFSEYKQRTNEVHGTFMAGQPDQQWTLSNNATAVTNASDPRNFKILPDITDRIFGRFYDGSLVSDPFHHFYYFDVTRISNKEVYGTPTV